MPRTEAQAATIRRILESETPTDVLGEMYQSCADLGGTMFSYHPVVMFEGIASNVSDVFAVGWPDGWREYYIDRGARLVDPGPDITMRLGKPTWWHDALSKRKLTQAEQDYVTETRKFGITSGLGFPLWGPQGNNAFVAVGFADPKLAWSVTRINLQHTMLLVGHRRIVELLPLAEEIPGLSSREIEVLTWIGRGKSNTDVGTILAISPETVATYTRRIFSKLDCHDRIGAVIKALRLGLIRV